MQLPARRRCAPRRLCLASAVTPVPIPGFGLADEAFETDSEAEAAILGAGDLNVASEVVGEEIGGEAIGGDGFIHGGGVEAGFEFGATEKRLLGEGDALDREQLLGVNGPVGGDGVGARFSRESSSSRRTTANLAAAKPCLREFREERVLPSGVRGPVEFCALAGPEGTPAARRSLETGLVVFGIHIAIASGRAMGRGWRR